MKLLYKKRRNIKSKKIHPGKYRRLAYIHDYSANQFLGSSALLEAEESAKSSKTGLWETFDPNFNQESVDSLETLSLVESVFEGKKVVISSFTLEEIHIQILGEEAILLEKMMSAFTSHYLKSGQRLDNPQVGDYCAALFSLDSLYYRAQIISRNDVNCTVRFIDFGNVERVSALNLYKLENSHSLSVLKPQSHLISLMVNFSESQDYYAEISDVINASKCYKASVVKGNILILTSEKSEFSLNEDLLRNGYCYTLQLSELPDSKKKILQKLDESLLLAKKNHLNIWRYGDFRQD
jgi:staphylococcal nuclease domain-containing protein 1